MVIYIYANIYLTVAKHLPHCCATFKAQYNSIHLKYLASSTNSLIFENDLILSQFASI